MTVWPWLRVAVCPVTNNLPDFRETAQIYGAPHHEIFVSGKFGYGFPDALQALVAPENGKDIKDWRGDCATRNSSTQGLRHLSQTKFMGFGKLAHKGLQTCCIPRCEANEPGLKLSKQRNGFGRHQLGRLGIVSQWPSLEVERGIFCQLDQVLGALLHRWHGHLEQSEVGVIKLALQNAFQVPSHKASQSDVVGLLEIMQVQRPQLIEIEAGR